MEVQSSVNRHESQGIKGVIYGPAGIGKTTLIYTLPEDNTLVLDLEAGLLAAKGWKGDSVSIRKWEEARALAAVIGGPNPSSQDGMPYSKDYCDRAAEFIGAKLDIAKYRNVFTDSITVASRICKDWCLKQPEAYTQQGKLDPRKVYGMIATEMLNWLTQLQHAKGKDVWLVGILDRVQQEDGSIEWEPQMEGSKCKRELAGIVDLIITMQEIKSKGEGDKITSRRGFVCQKMNPWGYPAKDRSGALDIVEPAHLGKLAEKIKNSSKSAISHNFDTAAFLNDAIIY